MVKQAIIEDLEGRRLLSVVPLPMMTYAHVQPAATTAHKTVSASAKSKSATTPTPPTTPPSVEGIWRGKMTVKVFPFFKYKEDLGLDFHDLVTGSVKGRLSVESDDYSGKWTGNLKPTGHFSYTLKRHGDKITITGKVNAKGKGISGTIKVNWGWRIQKGDFSMTKIGESV